MRAFFNGLVLGIIFGVLAYWYIQNKAHEHTEAQLRYERAARQSTSNGAQAAARMTDALRAKLETLDLNTGEIEGELSRSGQVVRHKAHDIGQAAANVASDTRAVADIKAKYAMDRSLSVWKISVSCNRGHVSLSGSVSSPADVGKAMAMALDAPGVRDVTSSIKVQSNHS